MKRFTLLILSLFGFLAAPMLHGQEDRPVALVGPDFAIKSFRNQVLRPAGVEATLMTESGPNTVDYPQYRAVVLVETFPKAKGDEGAFWNVGENLQAVRSYLDEGGVVIIIGAALPRRSRNAGDFRDLTFAEDLLGFSRFASHHPKVALQNPIAIQPAGSQLFPDTVSSWNLVVTQTGVLGKIKNADVLATAADDSGRQHPIATRHRVGKGAVYYFGTSPFRLLRAEEEQRKIGKNVIEGYVTTLQRALNIEPEKP